MEKKNPRITRIRYFYLIYINFKVPSIKWTTLKSFFIIMKLNIITNSQSLDKIDISYIWPWRRMYEGGSISNQLIPFPIDRDGHDFHALFQYMFYTWVQNCTRI